MKKSKNLYKLAKCFFVLLVLLVLSLSVIGSSSSSYVTTATQYGEGSVTTTYKLNEQIKISFLENSSSTYAETANQNASTANKYYVKSSYSESDEYYYMQFENSGIIDDTNGNVYGITDYFGNSLQDIDALDFADYYGLTKSSGSYGTLTYNGSNSVEYSEPLAMEWTVGTKNDGDTTINIAPFSTAVTVTVYYTIGSKTTSEGAVTDRESPYSAFYFNGTEVLYDNGYYEGTDTNSQNNTTTGVVKYDSNSTGAYTFTPGAGSTTSSTHSLYTYTQQLAAETSVNITTGSQSQAMIFLVVITPVTGVSVADGSGNKSSSLNVNGSLTLTTGTANTDNLALQESKTAAWYTSDASVATVSDSGEVTAVSPGVAQITYSVGGAISVYTVYVKGVKVSDNSVFVGKTKDITVTVYADISSDTINSYSWSLGSDTYAKINSGSDAKTVTIEGVAIGTDTLNVSVYINGNQYTDSCTITSKAFVMSNATVNITTLVSNGDLSTTTYEEDQTLYYNDDDETTITATASSDRTIKVVSSTKGSYSNCIQLGGAGSTAARSIKLNLAGACKITVYATSAGDSRTLALYDSNYSVLDNTQSTGSSLKEFTYTVGEEGTYYIASTSGGMNVYAVSIEYFKISSSNESSEVVQGNTLQLSTNFDDIITASGTVSWSWSSSDENIATVTGSGEVTGVNVGTVIITATATDDNDSYTATFTVTVVTPSIAIASEYITLGQTGSTTVDITYTGLTYSDIDSVVVTNDKNETITSGVTAAVDDSGLTIKTTSATIGTYKVTITDSATGASDYIYVIVGTASTKDVTYTATYIPTANKTLTGTYSGTSDSNNTVTVESSGDDGTTYSSGTYSGYDGITYNTRSDIKAFSSRSVTISVSAATSVTITIEGYAASGRYMVLSTTSTDSSDYLAKNDGDGAFELSATVTNVTDGKYYIYSTTGDSVYLYAIKITYTVSETTIEYPSAASEISTTAGSSDQTVTLNGGTAISLDTSVATVDSDGKIKGVAEGTTYIIVESSTGALTLYKVTVGAGTSG